MSSKKYNNLIKAFDELSNDEKSKLITKIMGMVNEPRTKNTPNKNGAPVKKYSRGDAKPDCPHCKARADFGCILKKGFQKDTQRYYCKECKRYFVANTNTAFQKTRKSVETWERFIELTVSGKSLTVCTDECNICIQTAFTWRHKILNAFRIHQGSAHMAGTIELDEALFPISYKGNHVKGEFSQPRLADPNSFNGLPRKAFKRGSDNRSSSSNDKACVFCMIKNGNEGFYATVPGVGYMKNHMLDNTLGKHVDKDNSIIVADQYRVTSAYLRDNNYHYMTLASNTSNNPNGHKPEIHGQYHLQHINAFHHHLRKFLAAYCGVSTKYLENYVSLYVWLKNLAANKQKKQIKKISVRRATDPDCYITRREIESRPAVPSCA